MSEWIKAEHQLPADCTLVIASTEEFKGRGRVSIPARYDGVAKRWLSADSEDFDVDTCEPELIGVIAWRPLPSYEG